MTTPAAWYPDPEGRHQFRYWDGSRWTDDVADGGVASIDPLTAAPVAIETPAAQGPVEFDSDGKVASIEHLNQGGWIHSNSDSAQYYTCPGKSLFEAAEFLKDLPSIPPMTYYLVDTPDGTLGRDMDDFFTEQPIKTKNLTVAAPERGPAAVEFASLTSFGDGIKSQGAVANMKAAGRYANFILLMECGRCGYKSPVETEGGHLERQCYCCGATNDGMRGMISVISGNGRMTAI